MEAIIIVYLMRVKMETITTVHLICDKMENQRHTISIYLSKANISQIKYNGTYVASFYQRHTLSNFLSATFCQRQTLSNVLSTTHIKQCFSNDTHLAIF